MPQLTDIIKKRDKKKFIKKSYRPWNLNGNKSDQVIETNDTNLLIQNIIENNNLLIEPQQISAAKESTPTKSNLVELKQSTKLENRKISNREQLDNNEITIREQLDDNKITNREQLDNNKSVIREQLDNNRVTNREHFREQLDNTLDPNSLRNRIAKLSGIQKKILDFLVEICMARDSTETGAIETSLISQHISISYGSVKTSVKRLIIKEILERKKGRAARGGYINISISKEVQCVYLELKQKYLQYSNPMEFVKSLREQIDNKLDNKNAIYSSSNINITTTDLPREFKMINIEPLRDIGFSHSQLKQLVGKNSPDIIQESILHFAFALENNPKCKTYDKPLNVIMGVLRKGQGWVESNYRSPQEIAQEQFLKHKQEEKERLKTLEDKAVKEAFSDWKSSISDKEINEIIRIDKSPITPKDVKLRKYFLDNVWNEVKKDYLIQNFNG